MSWQPKKTTSLKRKRSSKEDELQIKCADYLRRVFPNLTWCHIANERATSPQRGAKLKAMGVTAGMPDLLIFDWQCAIELKQGTNKPTADQERILSALRTLDWQTYVCYDFRQFLVAIAPHAGMSVEEMDMRYVKNKYGN